MNPINKVAISAAAALIAFTAAAQRTQKFTADRNNEYGLTYKLPSTRVRILATAVKTVRKAGPYWQYAKKYLGTSDVITADSQTWELTGASMHTYGVPDDSQQFLMQFKGGQAPFIMKTTDDLLLSVNSENTVPLEPSLSATVGRETVLDANNYLSSLSGDILASESLSKRAELAAQQIYKIRQSRSDYATGEADTMPDGAALKLIIQQLDEQEAALTAMFVGTTSTSTASQAFEFNPGTDDVDNAVAFRVSDENGLVDKSDLSGEPVYLTMRVTERGKHPVNEKGEAKKLPKDAVVYRIPGKAQFTLAYKGKTVAQSSFDLAQLGIDFGLDPDLFSNKKQQSYIKLSPATGAVVELGNVAR